MEERQWEKVTVDEATRMRLNGESARCMAHIRAIKKAGGVSLQESDGSDTSKDQAWTTLESQMNPKIGVISVSRYSEPRNPLRVPFSAPQGLTSRAWQHALLATP